MEKGTESDSALSGQTEKHIVSLDALCNLAPFTPQSEKSMANGRPKHQKPCVRKREKETEKTTKKRERTERKSTLFPRQDDNYVLSSIQELYLFRHFLITLLRNKMFL